MKALRYRTGKKKIKYNEPDEFQSLTQRALDYIKENTRQAYMVLGIIAVIVVGVVLFGIWRDTNRKNAMFRQSEALRYYDVNSPVPGTKPMGSLERYKKAEELFDQVIKQHGGTPGANLARYYKANAEMELGDVVPAIAGYSEVISKAGGNQLLVSLGTIRLAEAYLAKGDTQKAIDTFQSEVKSANGLLKDAALYRLGKVYEGEGRTDDAKAAYDKLQKEYPVSPYTAELKPAPAPVPVAQGVVTPQAQPAQPAQPAPAQPAPAQPAQPAPKK